MAVKKKEETAEIVNTAEERDSVSMPVEQEADAKGQEQSEQEPERNPQEPEQSAMEPETVTLVYIGPSIPYEKLRSSMILNGTEAEIDDFLAKIKERYPEVTRLLVPPDRLTDALEKAARNGTILHKYYEDMLAKSRASRKG